MAKTYSDLLKHPNWQKKRLVILNRDNFTCKSCGETELTLHVHHFTYKKGRNPWEYDDNNFITLCEDCHADEELFVKYQHEGFVKLNRVTLYPITKMFHMMKVICFMYLFHRSDYEDIRSLINSKLDGKLDSFGEFIDTLK